MSTNGKWIKLYVAIYDEGKPLKHWSLFIDDDSQPMILHAMGSDGNFRFEERSSDARKSQSIKQLVGLDYIHKDNIGHLRYHASKLSLNISHGWNCQDFVIDLIEKAEEEGLIEVSPTTMVAVRRAQD